MERVFAVEGIDNSEQAMIERIGGKMSWGRNRAVENMLRIAGRRPWIFPMYSWS
jgi:hypothetical protein